MELIVALSLILIQESILMLYKNGGGAGICFNENYNVFLTVGVSFILKALFLHYNLRHITSENCL
jgi:hypothetical protein